MKDRLINGIGVDMGSAYTRIGAPGRRQLLCAPTLAAVELSSGQPAAAGEQASELLSYAPERYRGVWPVRNGRVEDAETAAFVLRELLRRARGERRAGVRTAVLVTPCGLGAREYAAWEYCATIAGVRKAYFLEEALAAQLGAGRDIARPFGRLAVSLGAGSLRLGVTTASGVAAHLERESGGGRLLRLLAGRAEECGAGQVSRVEAERIARELSGEPGRPVTVRTARGEERRLCPAEFSGVLHLVYEEVAAGIRALCARISPELLSDLAEEGVLLFGWHARLCGMGEFLAQRLGMPVSLPDDPAWAALEGALRAGEGDPRLAWR